MEEEAIPEAKERLDPDLDRDTLLLAEHAVRYQFAAALSSGKRILDVASGTGYGADLMAKAGAASVVGIDYSSEATERSVRRYGSSAQFLRADGQRLPLKDDSFEVVVSFETIEHVEKPEKFLKELKRVLVPGGLLIISSPNSAIYPEGNPFHVKEFAFEEFRTFLAAQFANLQVFTQDNWISTAVLDENQTEDASYGSTSPSRILKVSARKANACLYVVALCSDAELPKSVSHTALSRVSDNDFWLTEMQRRDVELTQLHAVREERQRSFERELAEVQQSLQAVRQESEERAALIASKEAQFTTDMGRMQSELVSMRSEREHALQALAEVHGSLAWRGLGVYRKMLRRVRLAGAAYSACRRVVSRLLSVGEPEEAHGESELTQPASPELVLPSFADPEISIVIPVHNNLEATRRCLESILRHTEGVTYEVIVVDDASSDATGEFVGAIRNLKSITHSSPLGYLRATNAGTEAARGAYLVLLNNDTEVRPNWINALLEPVRADEKVAVVGAKLLYPDLTLQEAGGIVWSDADACNYGRGDDPGACQYNYLREVDYCSAACLLVRRAVFEELGRFDVRFAPAYYEDTDLAFAARERGYKVVYQPKAEVIHDEGTSNGTDLEAGMKRFQGVNQVKFAEKWGSLLESQPAAGGNLLRARERSTADRLLIVDAAVPTFDHDSGSLRMNSLILNLVERGFAVTFLPDNRDPRQPYTSLLQAAGVEVLYGDCDLGEWLRAMAPELRMCLASRPSVAWRYLAMVREYAPECRFVFDTVDLHYLREQRRADWEGKDWLWRLAEGYKQLELGLVRAADAAVTVTDREKGLLLSEVPDASVHVIPNVHQVRSATRSFSDRRDLVFVGGFNHPPNGAAVEYFIREVFPKVKKQLPDIRFHVVGSYPPPEIKQLEAPDIRVTGYVANLNPYIHGCRLSVAPLTYGAGLKGKITQALSEGLPVVTTSIGAEGTDLVHGENVLIADEPEAFAREVVRAYTDEQLWSSLAKKGLAHAEQYYSSSAVSRLLDGLLEELKILT